MPGDVGAERPCIYVGWCRVKVMSAASSYGLRGAEPCRVLLLLSGTKRVESGARRRSARLVVLRFLLREEDREVDLDSN
jgi:hypothetical protein